MKKYCLLIAAYFSLLSGVSSGQTMVLQDNRSKDSLDSRFGQNQMRFYSMHIGVGFAISSDVKGGRIKYGSISNLKIGLREKYKINALYSMGYDLLLDYNFYKLKQEEGKVLPDPLTHHLERIDVYSLGISYYNRFNFDPGRGNYLGNYFDIGLAGNWIATLSHLTKDKIKTIQSNLLYATKYRCDVVARLGRGHAAFYACYRLSDLFKSKYNYPELPRLMAGLEWGIFR